MISKEKLLAKALPPEEQQIEWHQWQDDRPSHGPALVKPEHLLILFSRYSYEDYAGEGYVLGYDTEKETFFEVFGSHCSCYGLEGQWDEEAIEIEERIHRTIAAYNSLKADRDRFGYVGRELERVEALADFLEIDLNRRVDE